MIGWGNYFEYCCIQSESKRRSIFVNLKVVDKIFRIPLINSWVNFSDEKYRSVEDRCNFYRSSGSRSISTPLHQHTTLNMRVNSNGNQSEVPIVIALPHWKQEHECLRDINMTLKINSSLEKTFSPVAYFERSYDWWSSGGMEIRNSTAFSGSLAVILSLLLVPGQFKATISCGRSRNGYDKKALRTPLMKKVFILDLPETSLQASGPAKGKITRNSPEFEKLKPCYNGDIIFKDEERNGEDRTMSKVEVFHLFMIYFTFHHCQYSACSFLWGLCTLDT